MERQTIEIRIGKDGNIQSETHGIKGRKCLKYLEILQELLQAQVVDSQFTSEFLMTETEETETETITLGGQ